MALSSPKYRIYDVLASFYFQGRVYKAGDKFRPEHIACSERDLYELLSLGRIQPEGT